MRVRYKVNEFRWRPLTLTNAKVGALVRLKTNPEVTSTLTGFPGGGSYKNWIFLNAEEGCTLEPAPEPLSRWMFMRELEILTNEN